jgi:hypothetical protein
MSAGKLSKEERRRALEVTRMHRESGANNGGGADGKSMTEDECRHIRGLVRDGLRPSTIARRDDVRFKRGSLNKHIRGECTHDVDGDASLERDTDG